MKALIFAGLLVAAPALAQDAPNAAPDTSPPEAAAPTPPPAAPVAPEAAPPPEAAVPATLAIPAAPAADASAAVTPTPVDSSTLPTCSRTVTDKCIQKGASRR